MLDKADDPAVDRVCPREQQTDQEKLKELYELHRDNLVKFAKRLAVRSCEHEDVVQEAFLRVLVSCGREGGFVFQGEQPALAYLKTAIRYEVKKNNRRRYGPSKSTKNREGEECQLPVASHPRAASTGHDEWLFIDNVQTSPLDEMIWDELWEKVDKLPPSQRKATLLRFRFRLTAAQTAAEVGRETYTVEKDRQKAIKTLRQRLTQD